MKMSSSVIKAGIVAAAVSCLLSFSGSVKAKETGKEQNIIYLIGDGMGFAHTTAYRYFKANKDGVVTGDKHVIAPTLFDKLLVGTASTYPGDNTLVTDSAAGATALATGHKSYNGAIGITPDKHAQETLLERAKKMGMTTGVISTSQINHATPASFIAHIDSRKKYHEIAAQYVDSKIQQFKEMVLKTDIMLGGGTTYFDAESRNLVSELKAMDWQYTSELENLDSLTRLPALGLFAEKGLSFAIDSPTLPNRLTTMTETALNLLEKNNKPFFLMVEGSQIDWCSHANDIACAMGEMTDFEKTIEMIVEFAERNGNTTVVITADHTTGGLALGRDGVYEWRADLVHKVKASGEVMATAMLKSKDAKSVWQDNVELAITDDEVAMLNELISKGNSRKLQTAINHLTADKTGTGWTTSGHTAEDVQVFAYGPYANKFRGFQDNTDIAKKLFSILNLNFSKK
jgi:alkaline phosphatase